MKTHVHHSKAARERGFTLLEFIVVLSAMAILLSWGIPTLQQVMRNNEMLSQGNELIAMLHFAKSEALSRNSEVPVELSSTQDSWTAFIAGPHGEAETGCEPGQWRCIRHMDATLLSAAKVSFNNQGYLRSERSEWVPETLYVQHTHCVGNRQRLRIDISPNGHISSCSLPCDSEAVCP